MPRKRTYQITGHKLQWTYRHPSGGTSTGESEHDTHDDAMKALKAFKPDPKLSLIVLGIVANEVESIEEE